MGVEYSDAGQIDPERVYVGLQARVRLLVRVPSALARPGHDLPGDFEPALREAVAQRLAGLTSGWSVVDYVAVEQFADSER